MVVAGNGRQALESAEHVHPDLVLTDVMMPEMDGFGLLSAHPAKSSAAHHSRDHAVGTRRRGIAD